MTDRDALRGIGGISIIAAVAPIYALTEDAPSPYLHFAAWTILAGTLCVAYGIVRYGRFLLPLAFVLACLGLARFTSYPLPIERASTRIEREERAQDENRLAVRRIHDAASIAVFSIAALAILWPRKGKGKDDDQGEDKPEHKRSTRQAPGW